jgi:hypothetical protein
MKDELAKKWLGKLTKLNAATGSGKCRGKAPHKPLLLLCLLDMAEAGKLAGRTFTRTAELVLRFKTYGALVSERWPTRLDMRMPFFYLRTQGFWQAFTLEMTTAQSPESCFVCELHEEFFDLLADADFRLKARLLLVSRYFEPRERLALLVSLGLCVDGGGQERAAHRRAEQGGRGSGAQERPERAVRGAGGVALQIHLRADGIVLPDGGRCGHRGRGAY